jgi:hypothetical protein
MSLNKVLNRPMFRKEALRKGVLKTINANTGVMVGQPYTSAPVPAIRKPPTAFERFKVSGPVRGIKSLAKGSINPALLGGYIAGDKVAEGLGIENPVGQMGFGLGGSYAASRMLPAAMGLGTLPSLAILGTAYGGKKLYDAGVKERARINAMSPAERKAFEIEQRNAATDYMNVSDEELFGKFVPKAPKEFETKKSAAAPKEGPGSGRPSMRVKSKELKAEGDELLQDANDQDIANLDTIQENTLTGGTPPAPGDDGITNYTNTKTEDRERREAEALLTAPEKKAQKAESTAQGNNEIALGGPSDDVEFNKTIALAKKYQEEVFKGEGSQANLVFLANLASGLLTGTTAKAGIGGAMEVFGQAIGPAVNNYATIKLKEGELRARNREASLNAAVDHMKFLNDAALAESEGRKPAEIDQYGIVQIRGADGRLRNYTGIMYKNGTVGMPAGLGPDGREQYVPVAQGGPIKDTQGNVIGNFEQFKEQKTLGKDLIKYHDTLGNKYTALSITRDVLKTLSQTDSSGEQVKAGAALSIDQFTRRLTGVAQEVLGIDIGANLDQAEAKVQELYETEKLLIENDPSLSDEAKKRELNLIDKDSLLKKARKRLTKTGVLSGLTRDEQEKLAVQEVSLVYALANSFKDQDRLTQRDVDNAQKIVNIFSLGRSSLDVKASIEAIAKQLESNIRTQETLYTVAGGLESTLQNLRQLKNFTPFEGEGGVASQLSQDLSLEEIENIIEGIN